ncbi:MAG TPA: hypothetical protein VE913_01680 [Longimicrobium sp.]|nr:hypothetical protein [Longimicrobium sp.]
MAMAFVAAWAVATRTPWWMCLGTTLGVVKGVVTTYEVNYVRAHGDQVGVHPWVMRLGQLLTWAGLLLIFVPLFGPRVWVYLGP